MGQSDVTDRPGDAMAAGAFVLLFALLSVMGAALLQDGDTWWHVRVGTTILDTHVLPTVDVYSFTALGEPWIAKEWLSQVVLAQAYAVGGWPGVVLLTATAVGSAFALLAGFLRRRLSLVATVLTLGIAFLLASPHIIARPHALALPVLVLWVRTLVVAEERDTGPSWWLLGLMVLWVNLHGSFLLGLVFAGAFAVAAVVEAPADGRGKVVRRWGVFLAASTACALVTPYGVGTLRAALDVLSLGPALQVIVEWRPPDLSVISAFVVVLMLAIGSLLVKGLVLPWPRALLVLGVLYLALSAVRNGELLAFVAPLLLAGPAASQHPSIAAEADVSGVRASRRVSTWVVAMVLSAAVAAATLAFSEAAPAVAGSPEAAVDALATVGADRVLNDYGFGGYLVFRGIPTFIDGRTELHGSTAVLEHFQAISGRSPALLVELLERHAIDATLLVPTAPAVELLDLLPGWERLHTDEIAVVHVRTRP